MPFESTKQRGFIHAKAQQGVPWAQKFASEADKMKQPKNEYVSKLLRKRKRAHRKKH